MTLSASRGEAGAPPPGPHLRIEALSLTFGGLTALRAVSFDVARGEIFSLIGPNGAGKTCVFNCISGIYRPQSGRILFDGRDIARLRPDRVARLGIARTFQNIELFAHMTTLENLLLARHVHTRTGVLAAACRLPRAVREELTSRERAEEVIDFLDLQSARDQSVVSLPYGVRKRVELGRALALEPQILLLDEPSAGMNAEEKHDLLYWIQDVRDRFGVTVLLVEHDMQIVMGISDRVCVLNYGETIAAGVPSEVQTHPDVLKAYLGEDCG
jgi:branched-chain amino acid transport system ATP-binding protein